MMKNISRLVIVFLLMLATIFMVSCGKEEKTPLDKALEMKAENVVICDMVTSIKSGEKSLYSETLKYELSDGVYKKTGTIVELNPLSETEEYKTSIVESTDETPNFNFSLTKEDLVDPVVDDGVTKLTAKLTAAGTARLISSEASEASIEVTYSEGKIATVKLTYTYLELSNSVSYAFGY